MPDTVTSLARRDTLPGWAFQSRNVVSTERTGRGHPKRVGAPPPTQRPGREFKYGAAATDRMSMEERLAAVERALTEDETAPGALSDAATLERRLDDLESLAGDLETRVADIEAGVDAFRGHVGEERRETRELERTASSALATAREVERRFDDEAPSPRARPVVREAVPREAKDVTLLDRLRGLL